MGATAPELARGGLPAEDAGVGDARESPIWLAGKVVQAASEPTAGGRGGEGYASGLLWGTARGWGRGSTAEFSARRLVPLSPRGCK